MSLSQLSRLLPLPEPDLQQILSYASTLSKEEAAAHFNNLLGESPQSIEFISSFNSRRKDPSSASALSSQQASSNANDISEVPKTTRKQPKKKPPLHTPAPRKVNDTYTAPGTTYKKKDEDDYISKKPIPSTSSAPPSNAFSLQPKPAAIQSPRAPPSASGTLISDSLAPPKPKSNPSSKHNSRTSSPAPQSQKTTKVHLSGGTPMHGASTALSTLDAAIRSLEISTNSTLLLPAKERACSCMATLHPLLTSAPNCLNCGKIICVKEGLGPCTFCGTPLLSAVEVQGMIRELREERGKEKLLEDNKAHKRADVASVPRPFS